MELFMTRNFKKSEQKYKRGSEKYHFLKSKNKLDFIRIYTDVKNQFLKGKYFIKNVGPKIHKAIRFSKYIWGNRKL